MDAPNQTLSKDVFNQTATHTLVPPTDAELAEYSLVDADKLVMLAFSNLQTAARIYKRDGLTQPQMVERLSLIGVKTSVRTIKRVFADLRDAQDPNFKPVGSSQHPKAVAARRQRSKAAKGQIGTMQPAKLTPLSPIEVITGNVSQSPFETERSYSQSTLVEGLRPLQPIVEEDDQRSHQFGVSMVAAYNPEREICNAERAEMSPYIERITSIIRRNVNTRIPKDERFTQDEWRELDQELQVLADLCHTGWQKLREHMDGIREDIAKGASDKIRQAGMQGNEEG